MPNSKHRKKQLATNRRQLEKARKKLQLQNARENECDKENRACLSKEQRESESEPGWVGSLYSWCYSGIVQSVEAAKDVVFPSRLLKRQLEDAQERLRQMEDELRTMKENESDRKRQKVEDYVEAPPLMVAPPPPPPPPPPPVPSVPAVPKRRVMTRSKTAKLAKLGKALPPITLDDIKKVKLKSTAANTAKVNGECSGFVISLADIRNVNLRKTKGNGTTARRKSFHCTKDFTPPEFCRMKLKRLNHVRSPGGSIIRTRNPEEDDFGEGPTPMLTRALRRKFLVACPISPLKTSTSPSPVTSPTNYVTAHLPSSSLLTPLAPLPPFSPLS